MLLRCSMPTCRAVAGRGATPACCLCPARPGEARAASARDPGSRCVRGAAHASLRPAAVVRPPAGFLRAAPSPDFAASALCPRLRAAFRSGDRGRRETFSGSGSGGGAGRQIVSTLPRCCTGAASRSPQIRAKQRLPLVAVVAEHANLDELVREQIDVDLVQHRGRETVLTYRDDGMQRMRLGAKSAALRGC